MFSRIKRMLLNNLGFKVLSLILSMILWYVVQGEEQLELTRTLKVIVNVPAGYMTDYQGDQYKDVTIRGPRVLLGPYMEGELEAKIYVQKSRTGKLRFLISKDHIQNWDDRLRLTVHDPYVNIFVDEKIKRSITIKEFLKGTPADGYIIASTRIEPARIEVEGLKTEVLKLERILTEPIDISGIHKSKSFETLLAPSEQSGISYSKDTVKVKIEVEEEKVNKRYGNIPVEVIGSDYVTEVKPKYVSIVIQGTPGVLSFVSKEELKAFVEVRDIPPGKVDREIQVKIPANTVLIETTPKISLVEIKSQKRSLNH